MPPEPVVEEARVSVQAWLLVQKKRDNVDCQTQKNLSDATMFARFRFQALRQRGKRPAQLLVAARQR